MKTTENDIYVSLITHCKNAIETFTKDKNKENFKKEVINIKTNYIISLTDNEKETIKNICYKNLNNENISTTEKNAIETLLKII